MSADAPEEPDPSPPRLLAAVRNKIRLKHYSIRTEQAYVEWIRRFIRFHGKQHPSALGAREVEAFLSDLAVARRVAAPTQNQAKSALLFLYKEVLGVELPWLDRVERAKAPIHLPIVLTRSEVLAVLAELRGVHALIGRLLYGTGMRVLECMRLRVKDVDFARSAILIRDGKGFKDRITVLPRVVLQALQRQLARARAARGRSGAGLRSRLATLRAGAQVSVGRARMGLAIRLSGGGAFGRPAQRRHPSPQRREHNDDLHPRPQPRRPRGGEPARSPVSAGLAAPRDQQHDTRNHGRQAGPARDDGGFLFGDRKLERAELALVGFLRVFEMPVEQPEEPRYQKHDAEHLDAAHRFPPFHAAAVITTIAECHLAAKRSIPPVKSTNSALHGCRSMFRTIG
jgi:integrase